MELDDCTGCNKKFGSQAKYLCRASNCAFCEKCAADVAKYFSCIKPVQTEKCHIECHYCFDHLVTHVCTDQKCGFLCTECEAFHRKRPSHNQTISLDAYTQNLLKHIKCQQCANVSSAICNVCNSVFCSNCLILHVKEIHNEKREILYDCENKLEFQAQYLQESIDKHKSHLQNICQNFHNHVKPRVETMLVDLETRKQNLIDDIKQRYTKLRRELDEKEDYEIRQMNQKFSLQSDPITKQYGEYKLASNLAQQLEHTLDTFVQIRDRLRNTMPLRQILNTLQHFIKQAVALPKIPEKIPENPNRVESLPPQKQTEQAFIPRTDELVTKKIDLYLDQELCGNISLIVYTSKRCIYQHESSFAEIINGQWKLLDAWDAKYPTLEYNVSYNYDVCPSNFIGSTNGYMKDYRKYNSGEDHCPFLNCFVSYTEDRILLENSGVYYETRYRIGKIVYFNNLLCISKYKEENGFVIHYFPTSDDFINHEQFSLVRDNSETINYKRFYNTPGVVKSMCNYTLEDSLLLLCEENSKQYFVLVNRDFIITDIIETNLPKILNIESTFDTIFAQCENALIYILDYRGNELKVKGFIDMPGITRFFVPFSKNKLDPMEIILDFGNTTLCVYSFITEKDDYSWIPISRSSWGRTGLYHSTTGVRNPTMSGLYHSRPQGVSWSIPSSKGIRTTQQRLPQGYNNRR